MKNYLFSFGDEFWHESGYDEGHWEETYKKMEMQAHFKEAGTYYLSVSAESNGSLTDGGGYIITLERHRGSGLAFKWLWMISLGLSALVLLYRYRGAFAESD